MNLKDVLGQIEPNGRDRRTISDRLSHGRRSFRWVASTTTILARLAFEPDAGAGVVHTIRLTNSEWARGKVAAMPTARDPLYRRRLFPPEVISYAVWLYFRFPLSLRMVEEMLAARGICVTYETVRQWGNKFGNGFAKQIRRRAPARGDKWHLDGVSRTHF